MEAFMYIKNRWFALGLLSSVFAGTVLTVLAASTPVRAMARVADAKGHLLGVVTLIDSGDSTRVNFLISGLTPGKHGVHIHAGNACTDSKDATTGANVTSGGAGPHFDPNDTKNHGGPKVGSDKGHAGDLENLVFDANSSSFQKASTQKIKLAGGALSVVGRSIIIHANEDNYTNTPANGGSGARVACGVIQAN
jgi:superoxide dismutase, Cu-Zn family